MKAKEIGLRIFGFVVLVALMWFARDIVVISNVLWGFAGIYFWTLYEEIFG